MNSVKIAIAALVLALVSACAAGEQLLPGVAVFSPGLIRLSERMQDDPAVHMEAEMSVADAFYVRDTSVLSAMLDGATFIYDGAKGESGEIDRLSVIRGEETLFDAQMTDRAIALGGEAFALPSQQADEKALALLDFVQTTAILERAPLEDVEKALLSLEAGQALFGGFAVKEPFVSERTFSDDGTRLTRIQIQGSIAKEGEAPWVIKGYLRQPAGRAPKDTFELTATQDDKNYLELSYSSLRQSEITKKNRAGKNNVDTHVKIAGEIGGYRVSERLTSFLRNTWTADGENLSERVVVSMTLEHADNTPGREMQRMNRAEAKMRHEIRLTTADAGNDTIDFTDAMTLSVVMDGNTVLDVSADAAFAVGGEEANFDAMPAEVQDAQLLGGALERAAQEMARSAYAQLSEKTQKKIREGLE